MTAYVDRWYFTERNPLCGVWAEPAEYAVPATGLLLWSAR